MLSLIFVIKSRELRHKGSEVQIWNLDEVNSMHGFPWQLGPHALGMEVKSRVIPPMEVHVSGSGEIDARPVRENAFKLAEYLAMGPTPGCHGCKAFARGDAAHKPRSHECRERVLSA